jgi:hypothetical protein
MTATAQQQAQVKFSQIFLAAPGVDADLFRPIPPIPPQKMLIESMESMVH